MIINGTEYLDANDYSEIYIIEKDGLIVNVNGNVIYPLEKGKDSVTKRFNTYDNSSFVDDIVNYFLEYNNINEMKINTNSDGNKNILVSSTRAKLIINVLPSTISKRTINNIKSKYEFDRYKNLYNNSYDSYKIRTDINARSHKTSNINGNDSMIITLTYNKGNTINKNDLFFIKQFLKDKLEDKEDKAKIIYDELYFPRLSMLFECDPTLICGDLIVTVENGNILMDFNELVEEHNNKIENGNKLQLKMKGF